MVHQRLGDGRADSLVIEGHVVVGRCVGDRPVVGDHLDVLVVRHLHQRGGGRGVDRVEHDDLRALRQHRIELLLLQRDVGIGVLVDHRAGRAELGHRRLEARIVVLLVAGRGLVGHEEGDGGAVGLREGRGGAEERRRRDAAPVKVDLHLVISFSPFRTDLGLRPRHACDLCFQDFARLRSLSCRSGGLRRSFSFPPSAPGSAKAACPSAPETGG